MALPLDIDTQVRERFTALIEEGQRLTKASRSAEYPPDYTEAFYGMKASFLNLLAFLGVKGDHVSKTIDYIDKLIDGPDIVLGYIVGFKNDYEAGILTNLTQLIEANIASDYLGQAEQLLGEGQPGSFDHVPAAVLLGAILEDALRRLCARQTPLIDVNKPNGEAKTLGPLIDDLRKADVYNNLMADQLRTWSKIRNAAAHGKFDEFTRAQVDMFLPGLRDFLTRYL